MTDVMKRTVRAVVLLKRNERTLYNQEYYDPDETFVESTHQRIVLSTDMTTRQELDITTIDTPAVFQLNTDRTIVVGIGTDSNTITISDNGVIMFTGSFTHIFGRNDSTTYTATIDIVATD